MVWQVSRWWLSVQEVWAGEEWKFDIAVSHTLSKCTDVQYVNTSFRYWFTPLTNSPFTQQITVCFLYCFLGLWAFCHALLLLTYVFASKIWICAELDPWHIIHILGFITPNYLPICLMIVVTLAIFQVWVGVGVYLGWSGTGRCCATCSQYPLASELFSSSIRKSSLSYSSQCGIIPLCQVLQKVTSVLVAVFIRQYSSVIRNITSVPSV